MFDQTDVEKVKYLLSKGIDYERAKKLVTEQKAISASTNLAGNTANQVIDTPQPPPQTVTPTVTPATSAITKPQYNINPTPAQASSKGIYPLQGPNAQQQVDNTRSQFDTTKIGRTIKGAKDAMGDGFKAGADAIGQGVKGFVEKPANILKTALYPIAPGAGKMIDNLMPQTASKTNTQQDILNLAEGATNIAFAPFAGLMGGIDANKSKLSTSTEDLGRINQNIGNFVSKVPGISNFRDQLPEQDQQRFDSLLGIRSTIALTEGVRGFNKFKAEYEVSKRTPSNRPPTSYVDENGNIVDYGPPAGSKALNAPEPVQTPKASNISTKSDITIKDRLISNVSGLDPKTVSVIRTNPALFKAVDEGSITTDSLKNDLENIYQSYQGQKGEIGASYQNLYDPNINFDPAVIAKNVVDGLSEKGITVEGGKINFDLRNVVLKVGEKQAVIGALNIINDALSSGVPITIEELHNVRRNLYNARKYNDGGFASVDSKVVTDMVGSVDKVLKSIPGRKEHDAVFSEKAKFIEQMRKDFFKKDGDFRGNIKPLLSEHNSARLAKLEELSPGITDKIRALIAHADYIRANETSKTGTYTKTAIKMLLLGLGISLGGFAGAILAEGLSTIAGNPELFVKRMTKNSKTAEILDKLENEVTLSESDQTALADAVKKFEKYSEVKIKEQNDIIAKKEAELSKKRAETYLQAQRNRQPDAIGMKTTTVTPEGVSKQSTVVKPADTTKGKVSVRETGMIGVRRKPQEVFQLRADVNQTIKNTEKGIIGGVKKALPDDKAFNRILELDTDPNYEKVTPSEVLHPKSEQYETQYGPISSVAFDRTIQKVVVNGKSYNRGDVTIFRKLSDKEIENNQNINKFGELRQKLQDIKSGKENKISGPQLAGIMEDLGIEKIADIPDESLQTVLDMARARVNKPSGILGMKKAEPKEVSKEMPPAQPREHQDYVGEAKTVFLSNEQPAYIKAGITPSEIINGGFIKKAEQFADKVMRGNNDIVSKKRIVQLIQREASEYKTRQLKYVNSELQKEGSNILNAKRDRVKELNNEFIKRHTDKGELKIDDSKPVVDSIEQQITEVVSEYPAINKYNPETKSAGNLILIQDKIKDIPGIKDFLKEKGVTDQQSFSDYIQSINRKIRPDINKQKQSDYDQARKDLFNMGMEQALQDAGVIKPGETPLQDIDNLLSKGALIDQAKEALQSYIDNAPVQEEPAPVDTEAMLIEEAKKFKTSKGFIDNQMYNGKSSIRKDGYTGERLKKIREKANEASTVEPAPVESTPQVIVSNENRTPYTTAIENVKAKIAKNEGIKTYTDQLSNSFILGKVGFASNKSSERNKMDRAFDQNTKKAREGTALYEELKTIESQEKGYLKNKRLLEKVEAGMSKGTLNYEGYTAKDLADLIKTTKKNIAMFERGKYFEKDMSKPTEQVTVGLFGNKSQ